MFFTDGTYYVHCTDKVLLYGPPTVQPTVSSSVADPGSGIRKKPIPDPGSRGQKGTGSRIRIRNTGTFFLLNSDPTKRWYLHDQNVC